MPVVFKRCIKKDPFGLTKKYMTKIIYPGLLLLGVLFGSCKNEELNVGGYLVDPRTKVVLVDTLTVKLSNIAVDSVISSSTGVSFAGYYNDSEIGKLTAQSYFGFGRTSDTEVDRYAQYDSATLILTPNGNYYGDTLKRTSFKIFRLVKPIELRDDGRLYSTSTVSVGEELLDTAFRMRLWTKEKVELTLPRSLGEELFNGIKYNEDAYNADHFSKTFPGLSLAPGT